MLILAPLLIIAAFFISTVLFGVFSLVISALGSGAAAIFIKDRLAKRLIFVGFCILSFVGLLCLIPFITISASLPEMFFTATSIAACVCTAVLSGVGIKFSTAISNKIGRTVLITLFALVLVSAVTFAIAIPVIRAMLLSN